MSASIPRRPLDRSASRAGSTLVEILAVVLLIILLVLLLLPLIGMSKVNSNQSRCSKNQSQLMGACVAYAQQEGAFWPAPWASTIGYAPQGTAIAAGVAAMRYAFGCFEVLASEATLPNGLFHCPSAESPGPATRARPDPGRPEIPAGNWADAGGGSSRRISYAFDWAAPGDPLAMRVVFSDRDPIIHKRKGVMACFGDSHTKFLKMRTVVPPGAAPDETIGMMGGSVVSGECDNPDAAGSAGATPPDGLPDNIFSSAGDVPADASEAQTALTPGGGDPLRAFVK